MNPEINSDTKEVLNMNGTSNILIVDDEEVVRTSYLRTLAGLNCNILAVWNGHEALNEMERHPFDVVLLDLRMPDLDGMAVLKIIKERWPESQVVIITGHASIETAKEAVQHGAYDYLAKPVGPADVIKATKAAILQKKWTLQPCGAECEI
jgi:DNA-binding NtrC family response regulator